MLKPGGAHVFSIPFRADRPSRARFTMVDGEPVLDEPVLFHTDPGQGEIAVYHDHGYTLLDDLASIGFDTRIARSQYRDQRAAAIYDSTTFVSRVPRRRVDAEETAT